VPSNSEHTPGVMSAVGGTREMVRERRIGGRAAWIFDDSPRRSALELPGAMAPVLRLSIAAYWGDLELLGMGVLQWNCVLWLPCVVSAIGRIVCLGLFFGLGLGRSTAVSENGRTRGSAVTSNLILCCASQP
jgi:hypothetical protein